MYSLYTHDCVVKFRTNAIYKFADDPTALGWISNNDESKEIEGLVMSCNDNNLSFNVSKTKELIIDLRKKGRENAPIFYNGAEVVSVKFLGVTITDSLSWSSHVDVTVRKAQQSHFFLRRFRKFGMSINSHTNFYRCIIETIQSRCITAWYGDCSAQDHKKLQEVVCTAQTIMEANLPSMDSIYASCCCGKAANNIKDPFHPSN
eukprot:g47553.t1